MHPVPQNGVGGCAPLCVGPFKSPRLPPALTGFVGERRNRPVALVTDDFRLYHELAPFFERSGVQLLGLAPGEEVPAAVEVLLGGPEDDARSVAVRQDREATLLAVAQRLDAGGEPYRHVVYGVDPGETVGLAVVADDLPLWVGEAHDVEGAVARVLAWRTGLEARAESVHVGDGAPEVGRALRRALRDADRDLRVSMVPEHGSTPQAPVTGSRHTDAAIRIARRRPL